MSFSSWMFFVIFNVCLLKESASLIIEGNLLSNEKWKFVARFCYLTKHGKVEYFFEYPMSYCCQNLILYFDDQWPDVYPQESKTCEQKVAVTQPENFQVLTLSTFVMSANCEAVNANQKIICKGVRPLRSIRARWWYLVISNCKSPKGLNLTYRMVFTNGKSFWTKHFSADEKNILQTDIFFLLVYVVIIGFSVSVSHILQIRQLFHVTYKIYLWSLLFEFFAIIINICYYVDYGKTGKPKESLKHFALGCHCVNDTIFVILLILLGKGFTVTRGRISSNGQVKLSIFCTFYGITYVILFIYQSMSFDRGKVMYIYESPAGIGICILRVVAWLWFCYGIYFTLKKYIEKRWFYYPFSFFYSLWFLSGPFVVLLGSYVFEAYIRAQIMNGIDKSVTTLAAIFFLVITRPSAANKNFPFHVRTSQIGVIDTVDAKEDFQRRNYLPSGDEIELSSQASQKNNIAGMFSVGKPLQMSGDDRTSVEYAIRSTQNYNRYGSNKQCSHINKNFVDASGILYNSGANTTISSISNTSPNHPGSVDDFSDSTPHGRLETRPSLLQTSSVVNGSTSLQKNYPIENAIHESRTQIISQLETSKKLQNVTASDENSVYVNSK